MTQFALNHMTVARMSFRDLVVLAARLGCIGVEARNDLPRPLFDGVSPEVAGAMVRENGLRLLAVAEVKRFNDWSEDKAAEALALMKIARADGIGVSMALFDDNFLTVLRNGIQSQADASGLTVQIQDAQNDVAKQLDQINNFIASGVSAIIVNPVDTSATQAMSDAAATAGVPLVHVNRQPVNLDNLPDNQAFVASNEVDSGTLQTIQMCDNWAAEGKSAVNIYVMQGELSNQAAVQRTADIYDVIEAGKCKVTINVIDQQTANWSRDQAQNLMTNWLSTGTAFDGVIANNDEMAIGAIQAMKAAGIDMGSVQVGGIDATQDALAAMQAGDLDVTVFQNAAA